MLAKKKIILSGGGTFGSVVPLIAIYQELLKENFQKENFLWIGTVTGPEQNFIENYNIKFKPINSGKLRRYFAWQNFLDVFYLIIGFIESLIIVFDYKPALIISAGGFVSVPMVWAGRFFGKKIIIHQQDVRPGLANKIMAPAADKITVTLEKSLKDFDKNKAIWLGNPVREGITRIKDQGLRTEDFESFCLNKKKPIMLVLGGGTGALSLNKVIAETLPELLEICQVIHVTGKDKMILEKEKLPNDYHPYEFLNEELPIALRLATVVISRAGMSYLTELSYLAKPTIIIPIPDSHQEDNAKYFADKEAVIYLKQKDLTKDKLIEIIKDLLDNKEKSEQLGINFKNSMKQGANEAMVSVVNSLIG